jgi:hypothetical protein
LRRSDVTESVESGEILRLFESPQIREAVSIESGIAGAWPVTMAVR